MQTGQKNAAQTARGKLRARQSLRDAKGRFVKESRSGRILSSRKPSPESSLIIITTTNNQNQEKEKTVVAVEKEKKEKEEKTVTEKTKMEKEEMEKEEKRRPFERFIDLALEDEYWKELIVMRTGLPLYEKGTEITGIFKRHVIVMGKENQILSTQDAKNYFANFTRKGTVTHKTILAELEQQATAQNKGENPHRYEETDPGTGERSYCGTPPYHRTRHPDRTKTRYGTKGTTDGKDKRIYDLKRR
jgi:hypothetical protein